MSVRLVGWIAQIQMCKYSGHIGGRAMKDLVGTELVVKNWAKKKVICFVAGYNEKGITIKSMEAQKDMVCLNAERLHILTDGTYEEWFAYITTSIERGLLDYRDFERTFPSKDSTTLVCAHE